MATNATDHLLALGEEMIEAEAFYLELKIEKARMGDSFSHHTELQEAENLWKEIRAEYYDFLFYLQEHRTAA